MIPYENFIPPAWPFEARKPSNWRRSAYLLYLVATHGLASLSDARLVFEKIGISSENVTYLIVQKFKLYGWFETSTPMISARNVRFKITLMRLTDQGKAACRVLGMPVIGNDWERMINLHEQGKDDEQAHTALVLYFAHLARKRGWYADVMPDLRNTNKHRPDLRVRKGLEVFHLEVETNSRNKPKFEKWRLASWVAHSNGARFGVGTINQARRESLRRDILAAGVAALLTDVETLYRTQSEDLWVDAVNCERRPQPWESPIQ